jgi:hypothetical protein
MCGLTTRSEERLPVMALAQHFHSTRGDEGHILCADKSKSKRRQGSTELNEAIFVWAS